LFSFSYGKQIHATSTAKSKLTPASWFCELSWRNEQIGRLIFKGLDLELADNCTTVRSGPKVPRSNKKLSLSLARGVTKASCSDSFHWDGKL
jgi:hypothetical protein